MIIRSAGDRGVTRGMDLTYSLDHEAEPEPCDICPTGIEFVVLSDGRRACKLCLSVLMGEVEIVHQSLPPPFVPAVLVERQATGLSPFSREALAEEAASRREQGVLL